MKLCIACGATYENPEWRCPVCGTAPPLNKGYRSFLPSATEDTGGYNPETFAALAAVEQKNFWFRSRNQLIHYAIANYFPKAKKMMEIGCGTGFVLSSIEEKLPHLTLTGSDLHSLGLEFAKKRVQKVELYQIDANRIPFIDEFDVIGAFDVLEHVQDDASVLKQIHAALARGGGIILTAPQHKFLWSVSDEYACHIRRYSRAELRRRVENEGFEVVRIISFVSLLFPLLMLSRLKKQSVQTYDLMTELKVKPWINWILEKILDVERVFIRAGLGLPFGGSIMLIARKRNGENKPITHRLFDTRSILSQPSMFRLFNNLIGADRTRVILVERHLKPKPGDRILDIGCGPADILAFLPDVEYVGFDIDRNYIDAARKRFNSRGVFICQPVSTEAVEESSSFDIILALGVLHHLTDAEALDLFSLARKALKPGGRLLTMDGCYVEGQPRFARFFLSKDRGKFVRTDQAYLKLARAVFGEVKHSVVHNILRIPYTHIIMECQKV